ncbi:MFS transporter [Streptomyces sp. NPDC001093]|uniref:MFS transporter n=1 Tax=Streptomyces sp. NPDC001093 TaxID=3154376 RepID=UPI0033269387
MTPTETRAGRKEWIALAVLTLPLLLVSMDITVLYFGVPSIAAELKTTSSQQLWMVDIYGFILAGMLITMGSIGDFIGRRRLLLIGATVFGVASVAAAFSNSAEMLITARALQGLGGATLMPSTLALVTNMFRDPKQRSSAIAVWSIGLSAGAAIGPVISGSLLNSFWWGSIFLINVPVLVLLLIAAPLLVPEFRNPAAKKFDAFSSLLSLAAVLSVIWGLKKGAIDGFDRLPLASIAAGLVIGALFLFRQSRLEAPMVDLRLYRRRGFAPAISLSLIAFFCLIGYGIFTTQYLMSVLGMRPLESALWTMASPALTFLLVPFAVVFARKVRPAYIIATAFVFGATGFAAMSQIGVDRNMTLLVYGVVGIGVGSAIVLTMVTDLVVAAAPPEQAGSVSALTQTHQELGGALGIAVLGTIGASVYRHHFDNHIGSGVPASAIGQARQTLGGAAQTAVNLPKSQAATVLDTAHHAFVSAMHVTALTGLGVALAAALLAALRLRHIPPGQNGGETGEVAQSAPAPRESYVPQPEAAVFRTAE